MVQGNVRPADMARINTPELAAKFIEEQVAELRAQIGDKKVLLALSGGVDSSVLAALLIKAVGKQLVSVHVNHGLLRKGEPEQVVDVFRNQLDANLVYVEAIDRFLDKLKGVSEPEQKRKIIGAEFIRVFEEEARKLEGIEFLAQGTIYPDIVESGDVKAHHNVGGLPEDMKFELVEPLKFLYKDEVRVVGSALGLPDSMVYRQPFPGPGLGVRCLGEIERTRLEAVRESDAILREEFAKNGSPRAFIETDEDRSYFLMYIPVHEGCGNVVTLKEQKEALHKDYPKIIQNEGVNEGVIYNFEGVTDSVKIELTNVLSLFKNEEGLKLKDIALNIGRSTKSVERYLKILKDLSLIEFRGSPRNGKYYIIKK